MAVLVLIAGESGDGKTTSIFVPPSGKFPKKENGKGIDIKKYFLPENYEGIHGNDMLYYNCDGKSLPFDPKSVGLIEGKNMFTSTFNKPLTAQTFIGNTKISNKSEGDLDKIHKGKKKIVIIDTMNGAMNDKEMLETKTLSWDKWYDLAKDFYALSVKCNSLRDDLIVYVFAHIALQTNIEGNEERRLLTNGKKLEKIRLESKASIVLTTNVVGVGGDNEFYFETAKNKSIAKTPPGMFDEFLIPNSLKLVDSAIRRHQGMEPL